MDDTGITRRELAEQLGVTKQTIANRIASLGLESHVRRIGKADVLDAFAVSAIADDISKTIGLPNKDQVKDENTASVPYDGAIIDTLNARINDLKAENERLAGQIDNQRKEVASLREELSSANERAVKIADRLADIAERQQVIAALPWWRRGRAAMKLLGPGANDDK